MHSHYQVLDVAKDAKAEEITKAYRNVLTDVMPKYSLYPTSPKTVDAFRKVQDAFECLISPDRRKEYDAELRELEAEEQSLFGERKARRLVKEAERQKAQTAPPPYVWNESDGRPLFWTPGVKLIEGSKDEDEKPKPVAYFRRASLDKALVLVSTTQPSPPKSDPLPPLKNEPTPPPKYTPLQTSMSPISPAVANPAKPKHQSLPNSQPVPYFSQKHHTYTPVWTPAGTDYLLLQRAREEERHKREVFMERERAAKELEKARRKVEKTVQAEMETRRRLIEKERELALKEAERLRLKQEREHELAFREVERLRAKQEKKVRWGVNHIEIPPPAKMQYVDTGPYNAWYLGPEPVSYRPNVLKKRRN